MHLVALLASFLIAPIPLDYASGQGDVMVRGIVTNEDSSRRISGAVVYAVSETGVAQTTTDASGQFYFLTLLPGTYRLSGRARGYLTECLQWSYGRTQAKELDAGFEYLARVWIFDMCL
jgi:hypothetical protein